MASSDRLFVAFSRCRKERCWRIHCRAVRSFTMTPGVHGHPRRDICSGQPTTQAGSYCLDKDVHMTESGSAGATASGGIHLLVLDEGHGELVLLIPGFGYSTWCWSPASCTAVAGSQSAGARQPGARGVPASRAAPFDPPDGRGCVVGPDCARCRPSAHRRRLDGRLHRHHAGEIPPGGRPFARLDRHDHRRPPR
jgi:hypothetical protein